MITRDFAFPERMVTVLSGYRHSWLETRKNQESLDGNTVNPRQGVPIVISEVRKYTVDYMVYMRQEVERILEEIGGLEQAYKIDSSAFAQLDTFRELARINADRIFHAMEFE